MVTNFTTQITLDGRPALLPTGGVTSRVVCPRGKRPGMATVLLSRADVDAILSEGETFHSLSLSTTGDVTNSVTLPGLIWLSAKRLHPGKPNDAEAAYVVRLTDRRHLLSRFSDTGKLRFNLRSFAQEEDFLPETAGHSWSSAIGTVWQSMGSLLGSFPGLPAGVAPASAPENLHFLGTSAWDALHTLLQQIGCDTVYDPINDAVQIVNLSAAQTGLPTATNVLFDDEPQSPEMVPETIRVYFHTHYKSHGQQRDTQLNANFVEGAHSAYREVPTNVADAVPGTVLSLWDDLPQVLDEDNLLVNDAALTSKAAARAARWLAEHSSGTTRRRIYPGILSVMPGSEVASVTWSASGPGREGTTTELVFQRRVMDDMGDGNDASKDENFRSPDVARRSTPGFPSLINGVQVWVEGVPPGESISPNDDGLIPGRVVRWVAGQLVTLEACWLRPFSLPTTSDDPEQILSLRNADRFIARLSGIETSTGETKPLYLVQSDQPRPAGEVLWGACLADKTVWDPSDCTKVNVEPVDGCHAVATLEGGVVEVVLPRIADVLPNLHAGDVIAFSEAKDTEGQPAGYVCVSDYTKSPGSESFAALWGKVVEGIGDWNGAGCTSVEVIRVADCAGTALPGGPISYEVLLPKVPGRVPYLVPGDVIAFIPAPAEELGAPEHVIVSDYTISFGESGPRWGVCVSDSQEGGAATDEVVVQPTLDRSGAVADPNSLPVTVYLPRRELFGHSLKAGQVVAFEEAADGSYVIQADYSAGPRVEDACLTTEPSGGGINGPERVQFDQRVGFRVGPGLAGAQSVAVSIIGGANDRLWQAETTAKSPQWTDTVKLARLLALGATEQPGAIAFDGNAGLAGPDSPAGKYLLLLPDELPDAAGRVMYITDWNSSGGTCDELGGTVGVGKLRFSKSGISGSESVSVGDTLEFEAGICVKWETAGGTDKLNPPEAEGEVEADLGMASRGYLCSE
ncbi:hypothetical protein ACYFX5_15760 [Bremerella sp. T1]|uniref:hypothetical protein n=1 Tax=Bremerella sp. TYQ1 TaxID=3119568 RepID=UPI001CCF226D|nr:hypothetical protein [Bremerella volcania]UBM34512.1 hypothetical protein LA756_17710 [Bremerella volcania]